MKKISTIILALTLIAALSIGASAAGPISATATPSTAQVSVDGNIVAVDAYSVGDSTYFRLRDVAVALADTESAFQVIWNDEDKSIELTTGIDYLVKSVTVFTAITPAEAPESTTATASTSPVYLNGDLVTLTAYTVDGSNYFSLTELSKAFGFTITYDEATDFYAITTGIAE